MKNYESLNASQVAEIKSKYGLIESKVTCVTTLTEKEDVWDVSLLDKETEVPHSIFTNGIITHNSFQAEYFLAIARHVGAIPAKMPDGEAHQRIFGLQNNDGKWVVPPRIRYYPMSIGEKFFDYVARLMRQLPDKLSKEGKWWLVYDPENKMHKDYIKTKKPEYNEKYYKRTGKWWVETEHGLPQALIITDSYPAMNPEKMDVDDPSAAMAMQARMFSDNIKRIKGKMSAKRITVLGINQLRLRPGVSFGCFHANTNILLADGTTKTIKNIVDNKLKVDVLSYNPQTKKVEAQPVTGWYNNGRATQDEWLRFKVKTIVEGKGPRFDLKVTKNHLLMDAKGYLRRAHTFEVGDKFLHVPNQQQLGETQRQLFLGSVLGDGWFIPGPADLNSCGLGIAHAKAQFQYLKWKYQILKDITVAKYRSDSGISTIETVKIGDPWFIDVYTEARLGVTGLRDYRVSPSLLSQISPLGLAVWAMDDASKERWQLKMQSYSIDDAQAIIDNLNSRFNLKMPFSVWTDNNSKTGKGWGTNLNREFMDLISPYVHDTFSESFERNELGIYTGYSKERDGGFYSTTAVITAISKDTVKLSDKYDIQVANNHLYVADGVVVENSPEYEPCGEALKFNCFSADTMLQTSKGLLYADELYYETREPKSKLPKIQGVKGLEKPPIYDFMGNSELIEVTTRGGFKLKGKPGHRVRALKKGSFTPAWTSLNDIHIQASSSYYIPLQIGANVFNQEETIIDYSGKKLVGLGDSATNGMSVTLPSSSSVDLAYLLGYFVAEGHSKDNYLVIVNKDKELIDHVAYCYAKVFDIDEDEVFNRVITKDDFYEFRVYDSAASQLLTYVGLAQVASHEKHVPWIIRRGTKEEQIAFLSALFEGDGSSQKREVSYFSLSDKLLSEVQQMLLNFGIYAKRSAPKIVWRTTDDSSVAGALNLTGPNAEKFISDIGFVFSRKQDKVLLDKEHSCNNLFDVLPKFLSWYHRGKFKDYIEDLKGRNKYFRLENFEDGWYDAVAYAEGLPTLGKVKMLACLKDLKKFINYTRKHNLIWLEVEDIKFNFEKSPTFDANMPDTHTIITNGFVSHNSDVRIRMASRSVQGGSGQYEEEPSINGGVDQYRYIHMRAHKNKLSVPNLEGWARIWVKDSDGVAHGFDPVYDAFFFMKELGLISGTKNKLKISLKKFEGHKSLSWLNFKKLILGNKKVITETLESIGVKGYVNLRQELFDLFKDGKAMEIFFERKKSNLKDVEEDD